jgi:hypothetical protein
MTTEISSRAKVRQWVREHIEGEEEVRIPDLVNDAVRDFGKDRKFLTALANEALRDMVHDLVQSQVGRSRSLYLVGDTALDRKGIRKSARKQSVFASWLEHAGDRHFRLMDCGREELLIAAEERAKRGNHDLGLAALWRTLAEQLEGGQVLREKFTPEQIEELYEGLEYS